MKSRRGKQSPNAKRKTAPLKETTNPTREIERATSLIHTVCCISGSPALLDDIRLAGGSTNLSDALRRHDTEAIYNWLMEAVSYQGISDEVAFGFMERNGRATWAALRASLSRRPSCPRLRDYWSLQEGCGYNKTHRTCAEPGHIDRCPLPRLRLRNGRLNVTAYSLYFYIRDIAESDLVGWIDDRLNAVAALAGSDNYSELRQTLIEPFRGITGLGDKVIYMSVSMLLMAAPRNMPLWFEVGSSMIAIDTLVHNFFHRTGILWRLGAQHRYGIACYRENGCEDILQRIAKRIDARQFNAKYPKTFPRMIQHAIWVFCSAQGHNQCNGNQVNDFARCGNTNCQLYQRCDRKQLHSPTTVLLTKPTDETAETVQGSANLKEDDMSKKPTKQTKKSAPAKKSPLPKPATKSKHQTDLDMPVFVLFGRDDTGKPRASRFPNFNPDLIAKAARVMGYWSAQTNYAESPEILKRLPAGKLYSDGKALAPPISEDTYSLIIKAVGDDLCKIVTALPRTWAELSQGHLVVVQDNATNGWFEAVVVKRDEDALTLRWRDYPFQEPIVRGMDCIALISQVPPAE